VSISSNPCESELTRFRPESNRGPAGSCLLRATECHSNKHRVFRISRQFWRIRKAAGLTGDQAESKRAGSADLTCCSLFSCYLRRATEYHSNERRTLRSSRHFCTSSRILLCHEPCFPAPVACLLPPAVTACYICCCCLPCENQAQGRLGLEVILGRVLSKQFLGRFGCSLEHESASFTRGKNPNWCSDQWVR